MRESDFPNILSLFLIKSKPIYQKQRLYTAIIDIKDSNNNSTKNALIAMMIEWNKSYHRNLLL